MIVLMILQIQIQIQIQRLVLYLIGNIILEIKK